MYIYIYFNENVHNLESEVMFSAQSFCVSVCKRHKRVQLGKLAHAERWDGVMV